jgi:hypothetical protein
MNPHREWFNECKKYDGGDFFLGYDSIAKIMGHGRLSCC